ncbi:MAG: hypothetical protein Kow006_31850 [Gammaproteobacteria bacterium]
MGSKHLIIPKKLSQVTLWVHPEGIVEGCLFLRLESGELELEPPLEVLNHPSPFIVVRRDDPEEIRFYNKSSIVRVHYHSRQEQESNLPELHCAMQMMDGSLLKGTIRRELPPDFSRLYDYLNLGNERFAKLFLDDEQICLVNKSYIVCVSEIENT